MITTFLIIIEFLNNIYLSFTAFIGIKSSIKKRKQKKDESLKYKNILYHKKIAGVYPILQQALNSYDEIDRVSVCFTIALNAVNNTNIVIFDESLSSLDVDNKNKSVDIIRRHLKNTMVFIVSHDTDHSLFDNVVTIEK